MKVIYARISTASQNAERQMKQDGTKLYLDVCSGSIPFAEREEGKRLLNDKTITEVEVLDIDRLGRNLSDILKTIETLTSRNVNIIIVNQGLHTMVNGKVNPTATMIIQIMGSIAQFEREKIRERCAQGIAVRKAKKLYKGRVRGSSNDIEKIKAKHIEKIQVIQSSIDQGMSLNSISTKYNYNRGLIYRLIEKGLIQNVESTTA